jgi:hypothetical protein
MRVYEDLHVKREDILFTPKGLRISGLTRKFSALRRRRDWHASAISDMVFRAAYQKD